MRKKYPTAVSQQIAARGGSVEGCSLPIRHSFKINISVPRIMGTDFLFPVSLMSLNLVSNFETKFLQTILIH